MNDICQALEKSRTTVLYHVDALVTAGMLEDQELPVGRTRKKMYRTIPFKVEFGGPGRIETGNPSIAEGEPDGK